jgi:FHA domain
MTAMTLRGFLDLPDGMAIRIGSAGLLLGRHRSCDLQLAAETASRRHALLRVAEQGVEMIVLGRQPVEVDGQSVTTTAQLGDGAQLGFPGLACRIRIERADDSIPVEFALRRGGERFPIRTSPFVIGGDGHVAIDGWPRDALRVWVAQGELSADLGVPAVHNGTELASGTHVMLHDGDSLALLGHTFAIEYAPDDAASTVMTADDRILKGVVLDPLPRGGRVTFSFAGGDRTVFLPGRRYRLIAALVAPPPPLTAGELVPDSELVPLVWNDTDEVGGRLEINVVLTRTRQDLLAAGIATRLLERAPGGRATRIVLAPGAVIRTVGRA